MKASQTLKVDATRRPKMESPTALLDQARVRVQSVQRPSLRDLLNRLSDIPEVSGRVKG